jgi:hypothetical protein
MQNREHSCFFSAEHAAKDSGIALKLAEAQGLELPLAAATTRQYRRMVKEGLGQLDKSGIAELTFKGRHNRRHPRFSRKQVLLPHLHAVEVRGAGRLGQHHLLTCAARSPLTTDQS